MSPSHYEAKIVLDINRTKEGSRLASVTLSTLREAAVSFLEKSKAYRGLISTVIKNTQAIDIARSGVSVLRKILFSTRQPDVPCIVSGLA